MAGVAFYRGKIMTPDQVMTGSALLINQSRIAGFVSENEIPAEYDRVNLADSWLLPGFIDLHVHGGGGADTMDGEVEAIRTMANFHLQGGTTSLYPTTVTHNRGALNLAIEAVGQAMQQEDLKKRILGIHLEGPYLAERRKGAQSGDYIRLPQSAEWQPLLDNPVVRLVTMAPELPGSEEMVRYGVGKGVRFAAGHTEADYDGMLLAASWGVSQVSHLYNAMTGLDKRAPGLAAAALILKEIRAQLICDGVHVHPAMLKLTFKVKGPEGVILITDALRATGTTAKTDRSPEPAVTARDGAFYLADGTLAGSSLTMAEAVRRAVKLGGAALQAAVKMATLTPAQAMGIESSKGNLAPGRDADLVIMDDRLELKQVWSMGVRCV
ncbi:MAG: N-acetylglucosamine-6-phosphate deacetylase [Negativicutes bacterium]|nr:N-acetylglucosamine-6-phosphate deacetylase [Negativicutes bacterium]